MKTLLDLLSRKRPKHLMFSDELRLNIYFSAADRLIAGRNDFVCTAIRGVLFNMGMKMEIGSTEIYFPEIKGLEANSTEERLEKLKVIVDNLQAKCNGSVTYTFASW